jgi:rubrerythrin
MSNLGEKSKKNLEDALAGESMARNKYDWFAKAARQAGYEQVAAIFEETALNEKEHAKLWAKELGLIGENLDNLKHASEGELYEYSDMYLRMAREAEEEGNQELAMKFRMVAEAEKAHETRYNKLISNIEKEVVFKRDEVKLWKCRNCGYIHEGKEAPEKCPTCQHEKKYFEIFCEAY